MENNVLRELKKKKNQNKDLNKYKSETLLLDSHDKSIAILEESGLDNSIKYLKSIEQEKQKTAVMEQIYNRDSFTGSQIKSICNKYDLRILPTTDYNGTVPVDLPKK